MKNLINRRLGAIKQHMTCANLVKAGLFGLLAFLMMHSAYANPDPSTDMLSSVRTDIYTNVGPKSTFAWVLYVIEAIGGVAAYMKTKNMMMLVGVVVVVVFTAGAFTLIGAPA